MNWNDAFGKAPESFHHRLTHALKDKEEPIVKRKMGRTLIFALVFTLLSISVVYAAGAQWGLWDYFQTNYPDVNFPKEFSQTLQTGFTPVIWRAGEVNFTLKEAAFDGQTLYYAANVSLADGSPAYFLHTDLQPGDSSPEGESYLALSQRTGKPLYYVGLYAQVIGTQGEGMADAKAQADGTLVLIGAANTGDVIIPAGEAEMMFTLVSYAYDAAGQPLESSRCQETFYLTLPVLSEQETVVYSGGIPVQGTALVVDQVALTRSALTTYLDLAFHIDPGQSEALQAQARDSLMFEALDEKGQPIASGLSLSGYVAETEEGGYCQHASLSLEAFPQTLTLQAYDIYEKIRYGTVTLTLAAD